MKIGSGKNRNGKNSSAFTETTGSDELYVVEKWRIMDKATKAIL